MVSNEESTFKKVKLVGPHCVNGLLSALKSVAFFFLLGYSPLKAGIHFGISPESIVHA